MPKLTAIIPPRAFELIRNQIGAILAEELLNQSELDNDNPEIKATVFIERLVAIGHQEMPVVNVMLAKGKFSGQTSVQTDGTYLFNIDAHTKAKGKSNQDGDTLAVTRLHRLLGMCQAILENPQYMTLGFDRPFIMNRHAEEIIIADPGVHDGVTTAMGRLTFSVKAPETFELKNATMIKSMLTRVKMWQSETLGYYWAEEPLSTFDQSFDTTFK